jgi:hypothetical protein
MTRARWMSVVVAAGLAASVLALSCAAGTGPSPEVLRAQRFELVDSSGDVRGVLSLGDKACPRLALFDENGNARVRLMLCLDGTPVLSLYDESGRGGVALVAGAEGSPGMSLRDEQGTLRASMCAEEVELRGKDGGLIWSAP